MNAAIFVVSPRVLPEQQPLSFLSFDLSIRGMWDQISWSPRRNNLERSTDRGFDSSKDKRAHVKSRETSIIGITEESLDKLIKSARLKK